MHMREILREFKKFKQAIPAGIIRGGSGWNWSRNSTENTQWDAAWSDLLELDILFAMTRKKGARTINCDKGANEVCTGEETFWVTYNQSSLAKGSIPGGITNQDGSATHRSRTGRIHFLIRPPSVGDKMITDMTVGQAVQNCNDFLMKMLTNPIREGIKRYRQEMKQFQNPNNLIFTTDNQGWADVAYFEEHNGAVKKVVSIHAKFNNDGNNFRTRPAANPRFFGLSGNINNPFAGMKAQSGTPRIQKLIDAWDAWNDDMLATATDIEAFSGDMPDMKGSGSANDPMNRVKPMLTNRMALITPNNQQFLRSELFALKFNIDSRFRKRFLDYIDARTMGHLSLVVHGNGKGGWTTPVTVGEMDTEIPPDLRSLVQARHSGTQSVEIFVDKNDLPQNLKNAVFLSFDAQARNTRSSNRNEIVIFHLDLRRDPIRATGAQRRQNQNSRQGPPNVPGRLTRTVASAQSGVRTGSGMSAGERDATAQYDTASGYIKSAGGTGDNIKSSLVSRTGQQNKMPTKTRRSSPTQLSPEEQIRLQRDSRYRLGRVLLETISIEDLPPEYLEALKNLRFEELVSESKRQKYSLVDRLLR